MLAVFVIVMVDEREVIDDCVVEGITVEWSAIVSAFESNVAFNEAIIVVEGTVLLEAGSCANEANSGAFDVHGVFVNVVVNTHRQ